MKKILLIDDSAFMRNVLKDILLDDKSEIKLKEKVILFEADGKINGLDQLKSNKPDLILLDVVMKDSELEGIEFLEDIRKQKINTKVIMVTSIGQPAIKDKCTEFGVFRYLQKPFQPEEVVEAVNAALESTETVI